MYKGYSHNGAYDEHQRREKYTYKKQHKLYGYNYIYIYTAKETGVCKIKFGEKRTDQKG